jgi:hypothetical protein
VARDRTRNAYFTIGIPLNSETYRALKADAEETGVSLPLLLGYASPTGTKEDAQAQSRSTSRSHQSKASPNKRNKQCRIPYRPAHLQLRPYGEPTTMISNMSNDSLMYLIPNAQTIPEEHRHIFSTAIRGKAFVIAPLAYRGAHDAPAGTDPDPGVHHGDDGKGLPDCTISARQRYASPGMRPG